MRVGSALVAALLSAVSVASCGDDADVVIAETGSAEATGLAAATTTSTVATEVEPSTTAPTTTVVVAPPEVIGHGYAAGTLVAQVDQTLGEYRIADGSLVRELDQFEAAGVGSIEVATSGAVYVDTGVEDSWYSCRQVNGRVAAYEPGASEPRDLGAGHSPALSPDTRRIAFLTGSECRPDPAVAEWVVAPVDTVTVLDLTTGEAVSWTFPGASFEPLELGGQTDLVTGVAWVDSESLWVVVDGEVRRVDIGVSGLSERSDNVSFPVPDGAGIIGLLDGTLVIGHWAERGPDAWVARIGLVDSSGDRGEIARGNWVDADVDAAGQHLAVVVEGRLTLDGVPLDLGGSVLAVGW